MKERFNAPVLLIGTLAVLLLLPLAVVLTSPLHSSAPEWDHVAHHILPSHLRETGLLLLLAVGIAVVHLLNGLRVAALCIVVTQGYRWLEFNHDYTFYVVVYGAVFALMWLWVRRFSGWKRPAG